MLLGDKSGALVTSRLEEFKRTSMVGVTKTTASAVSKSPEIRSPDDSIATAAQLSAALSDASLNTDVSLTDRPPRPLPHSPALPSISSHHQSHFGVDGQQALLGIDITAPPSHSTYGHPRRKAPTSAVSSVSLIVATSPVLARHPRTCFTALPSVEKSQSTQALVHHHQPMDDGNKRISPSKVAVMDTDASAGKLKSKSTLSAGYAGSDGACAITNATDGRVVAVVDSLSHSLIKGTRSASCSNVPDKSLSGCSIEGQSPGGGAGPMLDSTIGQGKMTLSSADVVRPKDYRPHRQSSRTPAASLASLKSKTAAAASPPKNTISVDSTIHSELKAGPTVTSGSGASTAKESGGSGGVFPSAFSFMPSAVMKKIPSMFTRGNGSPVRKRNAMKPTASQHKALAELASNGELQLLPCNTLNGTQSKVVPKLIRGFLAQTYQYARQRIPTLNEFCKWVSAAFLCGISMSLSVSMSVSVIS